LAYIIIRDYPSGKEFTGLSGSVRIAQDIVDAARKRSFKTTTVGDVYAERCLDELKVKVEPSDPHSFLTNGHIDRETLLTDCLKIIRGQIQRDKNSPLSSCNLNSQ